MSFEARIQALGLILPEPPKPAGHFALAVQTGNLLFVSGQISASGRRVLFMAELQ